MTHPNAIGNDWPSYKNLEVALEYEDEAGHTYVIGRVCVDEDRQVYEYSFDQLEPQGGGHYEVHDTPEACIASAQEIAPLSEWWPYES